MAWLVGLGAAALGALAWLSWRGGRGAQARDHLAATLDVARRQLRAAAHHLPDRHALLERMRGRRL